MRLDELERTGARIILTIVLFYDYCAAKKNTSLNIMRQFRLSLRARRIKRFNAFVSHSTELSRQIVQVMHYCFRLLVSCSTCT